MCFLLQIYNIPNTAARKTTPTLGFKLKRGKLIQSSKFIGWKSSRHKRASSLQGRSCPAGLALSYLLLNASLYPRQTLLFPWLFGQIYRNFNEHVYVFVENILFEISGIRYVLRVSNTASRDFFSCNIVFLLHFNVVVNM